MVRNYNTLLQPQRRARSSRHASAGCRRAASAVPAAGGRRESTSSSQSSCSVWKSRRLFTRALELAEKKGKTIHLAVAAATEKWEAILRAAQSLQASTVVLGASPNTPVIEEARIAGLAWERLPDPKPQLTLEVYFPTGQEHIFYLGPHAPRLTPKEIDLLHGIWLRAQRRSRARTNCIITTSSTSHWKRCVTTCPTAVARKPYDAFGSTCNGRGADRRCPRMPWPENGKATNLSVLTLFEHLCRLSWPRRSAVGGSRCRLYDIFCRLFRMSRQFCRHMEARLIERFVKIRRFSLTIADRRVSTDFAQPSRVHRSRRELRFVLLRRHAVARLFAFAFLALILLPFYSTVSDVPARHGPRTSLRRIAEGVQEQARIR